MSCVEMASTATQLKQDLAEFRSELSKKLDSVLEQVSRIEVEFGEVKNDIESLKVVIGAEKASAAALRADLVSLTERVSECGEKLDAAASTTSDRITALETKLDANLKSACSRIEDAERALEAQAGLLASQPPPSAAKVAADVPLFPSDPTVFEETADPATVSNPSELQHRGEVLLGAE